MTLLELAEQCEKATGPSYALELELWDAIYPGERETRWQEWLRVSPSSVTHNLGPADRDGYIKPLRAFTASIDAAMTLVPSEHDWGISFWRGAVKAYCEPQTAHIGSEIDAATPALALCAAALRARASVPA